MWVYLKKKKERKKEENEERRWHLQYRKCFLRRHMVAPAGVLVLLRLAAFIFSPRLLSCLFVCLLPGLIGTLPGVDSCKLPGNDSRLKENVDENP